MTVDAANDFAWVYVDGEEVGLMDRRKRNFEVAIPSRDKEVTVEIFVHAMGRINFGKEVHDRKGLNGPVKFVEGDIYMPRMDENAPGRIKDYNVYLDNELIE